MTPDQINMRFAAISEDLLRAMRGMSIDQIGETLEEVQQSCNSLIAVLVLTSMRPAGFAQVIRAQHAMLTDILTAENQADMLRKCLQPDVAETVLKGLRR
jgi:hypothetical protein